VLVVSRFIHISATLGALLGLVTGLHAAKQEQPKKAPTTVSDFPTGAELYKHHCAVCHGSDLKGVGPVPAPYRVPPDLTLLARRHGDKFLDSYVRDILRNGVTMPAHGPAEMPTWGTDFRESDGLDATQVKLRIASLTSYIKSRQTK
jgi:mono/diheme cytochrome c family protein